MKELFVSISAVIGVIFVAVIISLILAYPVMWLFNGTAVPVFGFKEITIWQAWGLQILCNFLFKSFSFSNNNKKD